MKPKLLRHVYYSKEKLLRLLKGVFILGLGLIVFVFLILTIFQKDLRTPTNLFFEDFIFGHLKVGRFQNQTVPVSPTPQSQSVTSITPFLPSTIQKEELKSQLPKEILDELPETLKMEILELLSP